MLAKLPWDWSVGCSSPSTNPSSSRLPGIPHPRTPILAFSHAGFPDQMARSSEMIFGPSGQGTTCMYDGDFGGEFRCQGRIPVSEHLFEGRIPVSEHLFARRAEIRCQEIRCQRKSGVSASFLPGGKSGVGSSLLLPLHQVGKLDSWEDFQDRQAMTLFTTRSTAGTTEPMSSAPTANGICSLAISPAPRHGTLSRSSATA